MNQDERRWYLLKYLINENNHYTSLEIPGNKQQQKLLLRAMFNVRNPKEISQQFLEVQDTYLQEEIKTMGITDYKDLTPITNDIYLWQGDITTLKCDAIVNAANSKMLGCFAPNHKCIDNAIHTYAGVQLRLLCHQMMHQQGYDEPTGKAKITPAFNLPSRYILHTVGPIIYHDVTKTDELLLASCYENCLSLAMENNLHSIAFCCISTGEFRFPNVHAAKIAIQTVESFKKKYNYEMKVIFNVFKDRDFDIYRRLLNKYKQIEKSVK